MFPAAFDYRAPTSLAEAVDILHQRGDEAKVMAGGQSLIPLLKLRFAQPALVVDIELSRDLKGLVPILPETAHWIADPLVRNRGTVGGSLAHADPSGDWGSVMLALNADFVAHSEAGERVIHAADFFQGPFTTALKPDEILTEIRIPLASGRSGGSYHKLERKIGDFATVGVAVQVELDGDKITRAGIGMTSVGEKNLTAVDAERSLTGKAPTDEAIAEAARLAAAAAEPKSDIRGSAEYKKDVVRVYVQRGLRTALARAKEGK